MLKGRYRSLDAGEDVLAFVRETEKERLVIVLNLGYKPRTWPLTADLSGEVLLSTRLEDEAEIADGHLYLRQHEGVILQ